MLFKRKNVIIDEQVHYHHQTHSIYRNPHSIRSRWSIMKSQDFLENRCVISILTVLRVLTIIPYKCIVTVLRTIVELGNFSSLTHSTGKEHYSCEYGSIKYYIYCGIAGMLSCGITHTALVPIDLIKCRLQVKPQKYVNLINGFKLTIAEEGFFGLTKGWAPTLIGYSLQGLGKFGFYEVFKNFYGGMLGEENAYIYRTTLYLLSSASAELFADIALAPWEATKVRIQTQDNWASSLRQGLPKLYAEERLWGFYKGIVPLWLRQIPYTMMKFACFERTIEALYKYVIPKSREQCTKSEQLGVTFIAGYIAGIFCAIVSHPADTIVSKLNNEKGLSLFDAVRRVGFAGLWKGLGPRIFMIGTLTALQWFIYDTVKVIFALPRPPPPQPPLSLQKKYGLTGDKEPLICDLSVKT
ncbi:unnamed protein product [Rotaria sordida]|uniref:Phosphate carrier protein, mitochondrial n=2 Tax=Rotaria sordida TaxID=392033 RepID=A0A814JEB4_9BILA|nr:unnamed protein product [Rotaria sordida]CAF0917694.1 unnamed protein product [Rotaria sordida]CAF0920660.1 unnamed protein product [Rotaria sordida]CAF1034455.1 unnamed protein product [Rotaria sordida]CAF1359726.1 unnamed protein product [Rotaria sordida]